MRRGYGARGLGREEDGGETYLAGGVDDVTVVVGAVDVDRLREGALDRGVVGLDEVVLDELDHERGLACDRATERPSERVSDRASERPSERPSE